MGQHHDLDLLTKQHQDLDLLTKQCLDSMQCHDLDLHLNPDLLRKQHCRPGFRREKLLQIVKALDPISSARLVMPSLVTVIGPKQSPFAYIANYTRISLNVQLASDIRVSQILCGWPLTG